MQILKIDCAATIPPGVVSVTDPSGVEIWRSETGRLPIADVPSGSTVWISVEDWSSEWWSGVPKHALN